jgi:hypothetical protein
MPTVADTLCVGLAALREAASIDVADTLVRGLGLVQPEGPDRALFVMPTRLIAIDARRGNVRNPTRQDRRK